MRAEIVSVGSELLLGQIVDTNAAFIARQLAALGLDLFQKTTVGDNLGRVAAALETALRRADVVITTGGLGPTEDDITREAVARATGRDLEFHPELLDQIEAFFQARGLPLSPSNRKQAYIPRGAIPLPNPVGTAPCFILEEGGAHRSSSFPGCRGRWSTCCAPEPSHTSEPATGSRRRSCRGWYASRGSGRAGWESSLPTSWPRARIPRSGRWPIRARSTSASRPRDRTKRRRVP